MTGQIASLCFDDGFLRTAETVRSVFEARRLAACFCVLAEPGAASDQALANERFGDWSFWRDAQSSGHEVAPHGWAHERLDGAPHVEVVSGLQRTLEHFAAELPGFCARESLFHAAYLSAPPQVRTWLQANTLGVRLSLGGGGMNRPEAARAAGLVDCVTFGPGPADGPALAAAERLIAGGPNWLVLVLHGLDGEGWGPITQIGLERLLDQLQDAKVVIAPPNRVLSGRVGQSTADRGYAPNS